MPVCTRLGILKPSSPFPSGNFLVAWDTLIQWLQNSHLTPYHHKGKKNPLVWLLNSNGDEPHSAECLDLVYRMWCEVSRYSSIETPDTLCSHFLQGDLSSRKAIRKATAEKKGREVGMESWMQLHLVCDDKVKAVQSGWCSAAPAQWTVWRLGKRDSALEGLFKEIVGVPPLSFDDLVLRKTWLLLLCEDWG